MQLFDELASSLQDLPSDRYGAILRALSRLGIHVSKDPIKSNNDSGLHLSITVDLGNTADTKAASQEARFVESTRCWRLSSPPPNAVIIEKNGHEPKRVKAETNGANHSDDGHVVTIEMLTLEEAVSKGVRNEAPDTVPPRHAPNWLDQLPQTPHLEFIKSRDWASTELGSIEDWPAPLRLMTRKMVCLDSFILSASS